MQGTSPWEQQPDEKAHVYEAARIYFDLGPNRSLKAVAALSQRHPSTIARWSRHHHWATRAKAYDMHMLQVEDAERRKVLEDASKTEAQKWRERLQSNREEEWETSRALLAKAREMLACPLEDARWNWRDAATLINQAARLVRLAAGEDEEEDAGGGQGLTVRVEYVGDEQQEQETDNS